MNRNRWIAAFTVLALTALGGIAYAAGQDAGPQDSNKALAPIRKVKTVTEYQTVKVVKTRKPKTRPAKPRPVASSGPTYKPAAQAPAANKKKTYSPAPKTESSPSKGYEEEEEYEEEEREEEDEGEEYDHENGDD